MTQAVQEADPVGTDPPEAPQPQKEPAGDQKRKKPFFILYLDGPEYVEEVRRLSIWVEGLLLPVYGSEVTSGSPWCPRWREHPEAIAYLHGLWLAWQDKTSPEANFMGPIEWHLNWLGPTMSALRDPSGPFAGCKPGGHRAKARPSVENDGFLAP